MVRTDASGDYLRWTANLPASNLWTACGRGVRRADRGNYSALCTLEDATASSTKEIYFGANSDGDSLVCYSTDGGYSATLATLSNNTHFFWAIVVNGTGAGAITLYYGVDGSALTSGTHAGTASFTPAVLYLNRGSYDEWLDGSVCAFKQWGAALNSAELEAERYGVRPVRTSNLSRWVPGYTHLDVNDYSGNGYNPTVGGTLTTDFQPPLAWGMCSGLGAGA